MHWAGHGGALWGGGGAVGQGGVFWRVILHRAKARRTLTHLPYLVQLSDNKKQEKTLPRRLLTQGFEASAGTKKLYMIKAY